MTKMTRFSLFPFLFLLIINGCSTNQQADQEDIFKYKDSYVGDNSAVINITSQLSLADDIIGFEIKSKAAPFGLIIQYDWPEKEVVSGTAVIHDATYLFTLVQNVDWITFESDSFNYEISKNDIQKWYGRELSAIQTEEELKELIQEQVKDDEKVTRFYND